MLICSNGVCIVETEEELPQLDGLQLFLDLETTSRDPEKDSLNPWFDCWIAGICVAVDQSAVFYIPVGHHLGRNINQVAVYDWLIDLMKRIPEWVNHNLKYDAHVIENQTGYRYQGRMVDTVVLARLLNSDLMSHSLDNLMKEWLPDVAGKAGDVLSPYLIKNKDFGRIPIDILGFYGGQDVVCNRRLFKFIMDTMPPECAYLVEVEIAVTSILYDIERLGMRTTPALLQAMNIYYIQALFKIEHEILEKTGYNIRPHVNDDCYDLLHNGYNLPVIKWTQDDEGNDLNPSFAKDVLQNYLAVPGAPTEIINLLLQYREMNTFRNLFLETYLRLNVNGVLHPDMNQTVRTGRMSVRRPNNQQLNKNAKKLILPDPGCSFLSVDYSQIEFRLIVHYIQNEAAIRAYNENPDTDFHQWVADMCRIRRRPAKTVNFCMGYGGGRKRLVSILAKEPELVAGLKTKIEALGLPQAEMMVRFEASAIAQGENIYEMYHKQLPSLKPTSRKAEMLCRQRGYVRNLFGRRRYLDNKRCHISFNALNQSTAADIMKSRLVHVWKICKRLGIRIAAVVHDEILFHGPTDIIESQETIAELIECLESPTVVPEIQLSIPLRCTYGTSSKSWYEAGLPELKWPLERSHWHALS